jgi:hypothetical protein
LATRTSPNDGNRARFQRHWDRSRNQRQFRSSGERHHQGLDSLVSPQRKRTKPSPSLFRSTEERRSPGILFLVSIARATARRIFHCRLWLSDLSHLRVAPSRFLARPSFGARRCCRTEARNETVASDNQVKSSTAVEVRLGRNFPPFEEGWSLALGREARWSSPAGPTGIPGGQQGPIESLPAREETKA